jgi:hypothetical protein
MMPFVFSTCTSGGTPTSTVGLPFSALLSALPHDHRPPCTKHCLAPLHQATDCLVDFVTHRATYSTGRTARLTLMSLAGPQPLGCHWQHRRGCCKGSQRCDRHRLTTRFCQLLESHNPLVHELCRVADLPSTSASLSLRYAMGTEETCAIYCSDDARDIEHGVDMPHLERRKWPSVDRNVRVDEDEVDVLSFPVLHPEGRGGYRREQLSTAGHTMTRTDHLRHLLFRAPPHMTRCGTALEAFVLQGFEQIQRHASRFLTSPLHYTTACFC